ncbi:MAG: peptidylprolyl isomerase [Deltaproteobacteria bacterium]|nr:peptidylprolyl isomerase [Deltaproteobacteria bacterium]
MSDTSMKIEPGLYVVFEYSMLLETGERVGGTEPEKPFGFLVGRRHMLPVVENRLLGMKAGEKASFWLLPGEAFGDHDPSNTREVPREAFPADAELKEEMLFQPPSAASPFPFTIKTVTDDTITVDMNHPLAGKKLRLDVEIHDVRPLTQEEEAEIKKGNQAPTASGPSRPFS